MWITRIRIKHDCIIGNRCTRFNITTTGNSFNIFKEKGLTYAPQIQTLQGDKQNINNFIKDLRKDLRVKNLEIEGRTIFLTEVRKDKTPSSFYNPKLIHVKPVFVDNAGYEYWEVASWDKSILIDFIDKLEREIEDVKVLKIEQTKLIDIYFSRLMPRLTVPQKKAVELAFEHGFYIWPKKTNLSKLAKIMKISVPTFREHLKRAEEKLMPDLIRLIE